MMGCEGHVDLLLIIKERNLLLLEIVFIMVGLKYVDVSSEECEWCFNNRHANVRIRSG